MDVMCISEQIGQPVRSLQMMLRIISKYDARVLSVVPDGIYGGDTVRSVSSFQRWHSFPVTGVTDLDTWYSIVTEYRRALVEIGPAEPVRIVLQNGQIIHPQETNEHLYIIHGMLRAIGGRDPSMPRVSCNNIHDDVSVAAILWLQVRAGLPPSGAIDRLTWKYLAHLYRITVRDGTK